MDKFNPWWNEIKKLDNALSELHHQIKTNTLTPENRKLLEQIVYLYKGKKK